MPITAAFDMQATMVVEATTTAAVPEYPKVEPLWESLADRIKTRQRRR